ncbi:histidyl-tRNA synthase [Lampropedia cohaerens]|uniref:Histidine--tRNA ligase n=2 Tax=Lampropedia cohaerens TaxID=1610491 RepID=A0A0U1PZM7_9BURK|nr:histidyl-tRNA synthase [Lampropedia cohaerens]
MTVSSINETESPVAAKPVFKPVHAVRGMNDIVPPESARWEWLEEQVRSVMQRWAYRNIRTPVLEHTGLFVRGLGEVTDIVEKEMYSFTDRADKTGDADHLSLRPENTAGVVRAVTEHNLLYDGGKRLYYMAPMFRRERPQRGRYRQFHQVGAEALGFAGPEVDAEIILLAHALLQQLGLRDVRLELNSLGQPAERLQHRAALIAYFEAHKDELDEDARRRLHSNPLRILDTKNPAMQALAQQAPKLLDYLGEQSLKHFEQVQAILDANGVAWQINPRLVRGLDYYNLTVFEFITDALGAQGTICGGGRYDYLIEQIGGKPAPAVGWAFGVERVLELLKEQQIAVPAQVPQAYAVVAEPASLPQVMAVLTQLRQAGVAVQMHAPADSAQGLGSFKSQFKRADASGAAWALVFGPDELARGEVTLKPLRGGEQTQLALADIPALAARIQSSLG